MICRSVRVLVFKPGTRVALRAESKVSYLRELSPLICLIARAGRHKKSGGNNDTGDARPHSYIFRYVHGATLSVATQRTWAYRRAEVSEAHPINKAGTQLHFTCGRAPYSITVQVRVSPARYAYVGYTAVYPPSTMKSDAVAYVVASLAR